VPDKLTGNDVVYPATPLIVVIVSGVETIPGVTVPKLALAEFETLAVVRFQVTGTLTFY